MYGLEERSSDCFTSLENNIEVLRNFTYSNVAMISLTLSTKDNSAYCFVAKGNITMMTTIAIEGTFVLGNHFPLLPIAILDCNNFLLVQHTC